MYFFSHGGGGGVSKREGTGPDWLQRVLKNPGLFSHLFSIQVYVLYHVSYDAFNTKWWCKCISGQRVSFMRVPAAYQCFYTTIGRQNIYWFFCFVRCTQTRRERERDAPVVASPTPLMRLLIKYESSCVCRGLGDYWIAIVVEELSSCCSIFMYNVTIWGSMRLDNIVFLYILVSIKLYIAKNMWHSAARCPSKPAYSPCFVLLFFVSMYVGWHYIPSASKVKRNGVKRNLGKLYGESLPSADTVMRSVTFMLWRKSCSIYICMYI